MCYTGTSLSFSCLFFSSPFFFLQRVRRTELLSTSRVADMIKQLLTCFSSYKINNKTIGLYGVRAVCGGMAYRLEKVWAMAIPSTEDERNAFGTYRFDSILLEIKRQHTVLNYKFKQITPARHALVVFPRLLYRPLVYGHKFPFTALS